MIRDRSEFGLPINLWLNKEDAYVGLLLSSLVINLLGLIFPICVLQFYDRVIPHNSGGTLAAMVCVILLALAAETALKIMRSYVSSWSSARFTFNMGTQLFKSLLYSDYSQFKQNTAGIYVDKFNSAESIREYYCGQNLTLLVDAPFILVYLILMFFISPVVACVPTVLIIYMIFMGVRSANLTSKKLEDKTNMSEVKSKFLIEMLTGIHTIKALGMEEQFLRRFERLHQKEILSDYELIQRTSESTRTGALFSQLAVIATGFAGGIMVIYQDLTAGGLAASILLTGRLMLPATKLITYIEKRQQLNVAKEDLHFILNFTPEYPAGLEKIDNFQGDIEFKNVSFKYANTEKYILREVNLHIKPNEAVIVHGGIGSGKSTLLLLMSSLIKATEGIVAADGHDLKTLDLDSYRRHIAYMGQSGELFSGTILENLTLFQPDKYGNEAKELAKELGLHDIVESMPQAYDTLVGTGTVDILSKGHKQLILIIRALIHNPKLILFDEANLALDIDSDVKLRKFLFSKKGSCTLLLATYRPSLIAMGDRHIKVESGKVVEFKWQ